MRLPSLRKDVVNLTDYHAKYFAYELNKRCSSDSAENFAAVLAGAKVVVRVFGRPRLE
jgi:hypothetical protein